MAEVPDVHQDRPELLRAQRKEPLKVVRACQTCRASKVKCNGGRPACSRCQGRILSCIYAAVIDGSASRKSRRAKPKTVDYARPIRSRVLIPSPAAGPNPVEFSALPPTSVAHRLHTPSATDTPSTAAGLHTEPDLEQQPPDEEPTSVCYTAHGRFAGQVASAIDARSGVDSSASPNLVPFVDAPLFGDIGDQLPRNVLDFAHEVPRAYANKLVDIYWQYIHPVEPILDARRFSEDYESFYSKTRSPIQTDRDIWESSLNVIFALAVQIQEDIPMQKRDDESNRYFQRAWALLRPEVILWRPGSLELVQCLMLINRYLHCTNNQHKTWMTAGLAIRIAQNMCCHTSDASVREDNDMALKQKVWASCVALERCTSWALGKAPALAVMPLLVGHARSTENDTESQAWELELHEIGTQIQLAQSQSRNPLSSKLGLPRLYQQDEYHAIAVQLDSCLTKWEKGLPGNWQARNIQLMSDLAAQSKRYLLHIRLLHTRIYLYRPMLVRIYLLKSHAASFPAISKTPTLSHRLQRECARMCLEAAQQITSLIVEHLLLKNRIGILPWWYRIYYLHIAGTHFLAAMFDSELFTPDIEKSWYQVLEALRAHEHLSLYVKQCIQTFETLSAKIRDPSPTYLDADHHITSSQKQCAFFLDDLFQDVNFQMDDILFG